MRNRSLLKNQRGMAVFEAVPLLIIFVILTGYLVGFFGIVHTGILNSIAARNYAFETFRHRTSLVYFRTNLTRDQSHFGNHGVRIHAVEGEDEETAINQIVATQRRLVFGRRGNLVQASENDHNERLRAEIVDGVRNQRVKVSPAWIQTRYGICVNATCGLPDNFTPAGGGQGGE